jgi:hypothetical protein
MQTDHTATEAGLARLAGWAALALFVLWLLALIGSIAQMSMFPGFADQFIPAKIQANVWMASLGWLTQLAVGTAIIALALLLSYYLATPLNMIMRFALVAGVIGGAFLVAAGAGGQENIFSSAFYSPERASQLASAIGTPDLTVINVANSIVAGGFRSTAAYATGWAMVLWSITALKTKRLPAILNWIGIIGGILFALTVWIGPITGFPSFLAMQVWHIWLAIILLRSKQV